jgi:putative glutamine amidotransferase
MDMRHWRPEFEMESKMIKLACKPILWIALFLSLAVLSLNCSSSPASQPEPQKIRLIMTKPNIREVRNLATLRDNALLHGPGLEILGIHHQKDETDYSGTEGYVQGKKITWFTKEAVDCEISRETIFTANGCSETFIRLFTESDGILFLGGPDIPPALYGEKTLLTTRIKAPTRHLFEISFLHHLLVGNEKTGGKPLLESRPGYLVFCICLGMQSLNVALGGTLIQDIPSQVYGIRTLEEAQAQKPELRHKDYLGALDPSGKNNSWVLHKIKPTPGRGEGLWKGKNPDRMVLSTHHQAIATLGAGLEILATSMDGKIIEIVGHTRYPNVLGVQFHPEKRAIFRSPLKQNGERVAYGQHEALTDFMSLLWKDIGKRL